jgi:hypothetical protein
MKPSIWSLALVLALTGLGLSCVAQSASSRKQTRIAHIQELISSGRYVFRARSAQSMGGHTRQLTSEYTLKVTPDTVVAFLPYFGRAYTAPMDPTKGGIQFTSTRFTGNTDARKKGGWSVTITPNDVRDVQRLNLTVSTEGYATLNVTSTQRQPISFTGIIVDKE